jgi:hypothetical protein
MPAETPMEMTALTRAHQGEFAEFSYVGDGFETTRETTHVIPEESEDGDD